MAPPTPRPPSLRPGLAAATLSALWPGLGQWYLGRRRAGWLYALPIAVGVVLLGGQLMSGLTVFAVRLLNPTFSLTLLVLILLAGALRLLSVLHAAHAGRQYPPRDWRARGVILGLVLAVVGTHALAATYTFAFYNAGSRIFVSAQGPDASPGPSPSSGSAPTPTDEYNVPPFATPAAADARITVLLTGVDKNVGRTHSLTDTILVVTIEPETSAVAMVSFPRDIAEFPLYLGGTYQGKINSLMASAANNPERYPDGPLPTLARQVGFLLGIQINYFAAIDLDGFQRMIRAMGGVTVTLSRPISDPRYDWLDGSPNGFYLPAGKQVLNARNALAFVRSRQGSGDNDFTRAARQQQLLLAIRDKLSDPAQLAKLPAVLDAAADTIRTNFPPEQLEEMVAFAQQLDGSSIARVVLQPPTYSYHPPTSSTGGQYILRLQMPALRQLSVDLFGSDSAYWSGRFDASGVPIPLGP